MFSWTNGLHLNVHLAESIALCMMLMYLYLFQYPIATPNTLTVITMVEVGGIPDVSTILVSIEKTTNCSVIQGIDIQQCCEECKFNI